MVLAVLRIEPPVIMNEEIMLARNIRNACFPGELYFTLLMAGERYFAIKKPFLFAKLTRIHAVATICVIMCFTIGSTIWLLFSKLVMFLGAIITLLGGIFITGSSIYLYRSIKRQCHKIASTIVHQSSEMQSNKRKLIKQLELKSLKICCIISVSFLLTYIPLILHGIFRLNVIPTNLDLLPSLVGHSNGIWDVLTFFYLNKYSRKILFQFFTRRVGSDFNETDF